MAVDRGALAKALGLTQQPAWVGRVGKAGAGTGGGRKGLASPAQRKQAGEGDVVMDPLRAVLQAMQGGTATVNEFFPGALGPPPANTAGEIAARNALRVGGVTGSPAQPWMRAPSWWRQYVYPYVGG